MRHTLSPLILASVLGTISLLGLVSHALASPPEETEEAQEAAEPEAPPPPRGAVQVDQVDLSPNGALIAYVVTWREEAVDRRPVRSLAVSDVFVADADAAHVDTKAKRPPRRITRSRSASWPSWSPDGRWLAFIEDDSMWIVAPDGTGRARVLAGGAPRITQSEYDYTAPDDFQWSPDGRYLMARFSSGGGGDTVRIADVARHVEVVTLERPDWESSESGLTWQPDKLVVAMTDEEGPTAVIEVFTSADLARRSDAAIATPEARATLPLPPGLVDVSHVARSPDGAWVAYVGYPDLPAAARLPRDTPPPSVVFLVGADGASPRRLSPSKMATAPVWSPKADRLAFSTGTKIEFVTTDGKRARAPLRSRDADGAVEWLEPVGWSPNGEWLVATGNAPSGYHVHLFDLTTGRAALDLDAYLSWSWTTDGIAVPEDDDGARTVFRFVDLREQKGPAR